SDCHLCPPPKTFARLLPSHPHWCERQEPIRRTTMVSTKDVLDHHLKCFGEGDLKGILSDYAPGAVLFTPHGPLKGADAIRPLFEGIFAEFGKPDAAFKMKQQHVDG